VQELIRHIRDELVSTEDTVCLQRAHLVTEAYHRHEDEPVPIKRARAFAHVLRHMDLDLRSNPILAGNTSSRPRAWMLVPEFGFAAAPQVVLENPRLEGILDGAIPPDMAAYWADRSVGGNAGIGHLAVDLDRVVHEGLEALIAEAERADTGPKKARTYRKAMVMALRAVIDWAGRYAQAAQAAAENEPDPQIRAAHRRVAAACRRVPARPARSLFEGLQAIVLVHLAIAIEGHGMSVSIGLPDRVLAPFIGDDFDPEYATILIAAMMLKVAANSLLGRGSKTQAITVGGADHRGRDCANALTACFLSACDRVRIGDPHLFVRWHRGLDEGIKRQAIEMLAGGVSMPLLIHDGPTAQGFIDAGVAPEDAWEYCVIGCNELGIPGRSAESATARGGTIQYLGLLNEVLLEHPNPDQIGSMSQLLALLEERMTAHAFAMRQRSNAHRAGLAREAPTPFTSALMRGNITHGQDMLAGMAYDLPGVYERGLTNGANALAAIHEVVYCRRDLPLSALIEGLRHNLQDATLRGRLLAAPKWGNDEPEADRWALELVHMRERALDAVGAQFGHQPHMSCHVVRSLHYLDGRRIAASPDGRLAWLPVADSIGAQTGTAHAGPTALLNSVLKLDAARHYRGGYNLNLTFAARDASPEILRTLVEAFFRSGGQELQINCLHAATLRAAQEHPERYGDLVVRVAGFSARFVDLSPVEQQELIERAEVARAPALGNVPHSLKGGDRAANTDVAGEHVGDLLELDPRRN